MATYRVHVTNSEAAASGDVHLNCEVQKLISTGPDVWEVIPQGHRTMVLDGEAVLAITEHPTWTTTEKRDAALDLFKQEATSWGIDESDDANTQLVALMPGGFPKDVEL
jgi:hypothetical protein